MTEDNRFPLGAGKVVEATLPCRRVRDLGVEVRGFGFRLNQGRPPGTIAEVVPAEIECDGPNPGLKTKLCYPLRGITGQGPVRPDERFLTQVLCLVPITGHPTEAPVEAWRQALDQPGEGSVEISG
jgi:hypothetical protein